MCKKIAAMKIVAFFIYFLFILYYNNNVSKGEYKIMTLTEKINNKNAQIAKIQKRLNIYLKDCDKEEQEAIIYFIETGDRSMYHQYLKSHDRYYGGDAWTKANEYYDAQATLDKYQKQLAAEEAKNATLNELPESIKTFKSELIERWDRYDEWKKQTIREDMKKEREMEYKDYKAMMHEKWGRNYRDAAYISSEDIHKSNVKDAENLILNLINRVVERVGQITDTQYLRLDRDNAGYSIINGRIIGTKGTVRIESIGAGGYNIQRYHIRVLVK